MIFASPTSASFPTSPPQHLLPHNWSCLNWNLPVMHAAGRSVYNSGGWSSVDAVETHFLPVHYFRTYSYLYNVSRCRRMSYCDMEMTQRQFQDCSRVVSCLVFFVVGILKERIRCIFHCGHCTRFIM